MVSRGGRAKALFVTVMLFFAITVIQFFAALISHSTALLVDCASMLVDTMTYAINLWAECAGESDERYSLFSSGLSLFVLYAITAWGLIDAIVDLVTNSYVEDDLEPGIVLVFGFGGLVFDVLAICALRRWGLDHHSSHNSPSEDASLVNMFSALTHVVADGVRSFTSIVLGVLVLVDPKLNGSECDDYATLVVAATILVGSVPLFIEWSYLLRNFGHERTTGRRGSISIIEFSETTKSKDNEHEKRLISEVEDDDEEFGLSYSDQRGGYVR